MSEGTQIWDASHHHVPPPKGESQPLHPGRGPRARRQGGGGSPFINVDNRLFAPLAALDPNNVLQGGYGWLSVTDGGMTRHPGLDLNSGGSCNADDGLPVVACLAGVVRATCFWDGSTPGEGNHVWYEVDDPCSPGPTFVHHDHLGRIDVTVGQRLTPGQQIGACSATGGWDCAHAHTEWCKGEPQYGWWQWPYGWGVGQVEAAYWNPSEWWAAAKAKVLAEGGQPVPPEVVRVLTDWQIRNWIMPDLWAWQNLPYNPDAGTSQGWVEALRAGHYLGRPRTEERPYGEGDEAGVWVEFESGLLVFRFSDGEASWTG